MKQYINSRIGTPTQSALVRTLAVLLVSMFAALSSSAATLPEGFLERRIATGLGSPAAMAFAPDGRLFVCRQDGRLHVIKNGTLLPEPFVTIEVDPLGERGLLGIAFDPEFASNGFVYLYYTARTTPRHNRVVRFTADADRAVPGSETLIFRLDDLSSALNHNGGAMHFGPDGKLYIAVGENAFAPHAQTLTSLHGKMLRINRDGSIPADNPFFSQASGDRRAIWALGLRNPFTFAFQPGTSRLYINDVGEQTWEEINEGEAGANYGWPESEGPTSNPAHRGPVYAYRHTGGGVTGCAITGGAFYNPSSVQFPSSFVGKYFFADFCGNWIRTFDPANGAVADFAAGAANPVDLKVGPDGSLYYLARGSGSVFQVVYSGPGEPPVSNPIDVAHFFVRQQYYDFLNREPDEEGLRFWSEIILACGDNTICVERSRVQVSAAFFLSIEFQETGVLVYQLNRAAFGRMPRFRDFLRDTQTISRGVIVGQGDWRERIEANRRAFIAEYVTRAEFVERFPETLAPADYVSRLVEHVGAALSPEERQDLIARLASGALTRTDVLLAVAQDADFRRAEFNRAFVLMQYFGYLRRNPDDPPDTDFSGHQFWLDKLDLFEGDYERAEMVKAFITSIEYRNRFGN